MAGSVAEGRIQLAIMLAIGLAAGAASFTHVHDVAAAHGQDGWLAWADAVVLELMSVASGLEMRRRRRAGTSVRFPAAVLVVAVVLSVSAQVVGAERSVIGWIAAAIPALGFLVMVKIALAQTHATSISATNASTAVTSMSPDRRLAAAPSAIGELITMIDPALMSAAREAAGRVADEGHRVSRQRLADALRKDGYAVSNARASELLRALKAEAPTRTADGGTSRRFQPQPGGLTDSRDAGRWTE